MAAEFHRDALHMLAGERREMLADGRRAGERHLADDRMRDEVLGNLGGHAVDEADHPLRHAGIDEAADQLGRRGRRLLGRLDDDRASRRKRARQFAHHLVEREVPGREGGDRADRLLDDELIDAVLPRRDDAAVGAARLLGEPVDDVGGGERLHLRFGQRLALLHRHDAGDRLGAFANEVAGLAHQLGALEGGAPAPLVEAAFGRGQRVVEIAARGVGDGADLLLRGGVEDRDGAAALGRAPLAVDVEERVWIHVVVLRWLGRTAPIARVDVGPSAV